MNSIIKIHDINSLKSNKLVLIDDDMNGVCLGIKSNKYYSEINFKFKVINYKNIFFGVILLKLDNDFLCCYINLNNLKSKEILKKLLYSDYLNLIVFNNSDYNKVYKIKNNIGNNFLINIPYVFNTSFNVNINEIIYKLNKLYSPEFLWNN